MKAPNFNVDEYDELLQRFKSCRKNVEHHNVFRVLTLVKPNQEIPYTLQSELKKYCKTNPSRSWGSCKIPAQNIWDFLFE